jgi:hypothetical protein
MLKRLRGPADVTRMFVERAAAADIVLGFIAEGVLETTRFSIEETFGRNPPLVALKDSTIAQKKRAGYMNPDAPLIATGAARASFETHLEVAGPGLLIGDVASDDPVLIFQEFGTVHIPPRPVVLEGAEAAAPAVKVIVDAGARELATGNLESAIRVPSAGRPAIVAAAPLGSTR